MFAISSSVSILWKMKKLFLNKFRKCNDEKSKTCNKNIVVLLNSQNVHFIPNQSIIDVQEGHSKAAIKLEQVWV
jgi:hypothetical protein